MTRTLMRTVAATVAAATAAGLLGGLAPRVTTSTASAASSASSASSGTFVAPTRIPSADVLKIKAFHGSTRHVILKAGTPVPAARRVIVSGFGPRTPNGLVAKVASVRRLRNGTL